MSLFDGNPKTLGLAMGSLDDDPGLQPSCHVFVASKAPWHEIADQLPQFYSFPPASVANRDGS